MVSVPLPDGRVARIGGPTGFVRWPDGETQCVRPNNYSVPLTDIYIAQLLNLRNDPRKVRAISGIMPPLSPAILADDWAQIERQLQQRR